MTDPHHDDKDFSAAEYALGVLSADERVRARRRMETEPAFAAEVADWDRRLAPLIEEVRSVTPPRTVWLRIKAGLGAQPVGVWNNLTTWRVATAASLTAAAACLAIIVTTPVPAPQGMIVAEQKPTPMAVAALKPEGGPPAFVVAYDEAGKRLIIAPAAVTPDGVHDHELWMLQPDGKPVSMGVISAGQVLVIPTNRFGLTSSGSLAVSAEPLGGSPTGVPTGPVVAAGQLTPL
ncbi:anti-sigma factor [Caulobacter sp. NIBR2454]|uniref:anti-sigma factor n=1 Tax=Caulobacter sp. NIBR2454 TaxID=3015996 RepID=UPI0022B6BECD|nr:anti-sigma factor [Caulobacter sp. NIBR2454]